MFSMYSGAKNKRHKILRKIGKSAVALWKPWVEKKVYTSFESPKCQL